MYFYCKSFPFSFFFSFFDGTMLFFEEMKDKFRKQRSLSAVTRVVVCLDACVSVSCGDCLDWSMDVHVASLHAFNCHLWNCLVSARNGEERLWHHSSNGGLLGKLLRLTNNTHPEWIIIFFVISATLDLFDFYLIAFVFSLPFDTCSLFLERWSCDDRNSSWQGRLTKLLHGTHCNYLTNKKQ